jgi:hypothetical protein
MTMNGRVTRSLSKTVHVPAYIGDVRQRSFPSGISMQNIKVHDRKQQETPALKGGHTAA